jgi:N-acetylglutamate synthase-like GNAT family acetyltransferase
MRRTPLLRVRRAGRADAPAIASVLRAAFAEYQTRYTPAAFAATTPTAEEIVRRLDEGPTWIALLQGAVAATVSVLPRGELLQVRSMAVLPEARAEGSGSGSWRRWSVTRAHTASGVLS